MDNIAFVIKSIHEISGKNPGKKTLQKIVFLIEQKGVALGCDYGLHFYGPYSARLDGITSSLSLEGIINFDYSCAPSHKMKVNDNYDIQPEVNLEDNGKIKDVINKFKDRTPSQLELLTTAIYAYDNLADKTKDSVVRGVQKIKGQKYSIKEIEEALRDFSYFNKPLQGN